MENKNIVIGIEGLVGSGKTSICRELLKRDKYNWIYETFKVHYEQYIEDIKKYTENEEELSLVEYIDQAYNDLAQNGNSIFTKYYNKIDLMQK